MEGRRKRAVLELADFSFQPEVDSAPGPSPVLNPNESPLTLPNAGPGAIANAPAVGLGLPAHNSDTGSATTSPPNVGAVGGPVGVASAEGQTKAKAQPGGDASNAGT